VLVATLALVAVFTGLLLRELGVRASLALAGGCLSVLIATTTVFVDRLQSLSIQWLPLGLLFALRYWRHAGPGRLAAFAACAFLTVQVSHQRDAAGRRARPAAALRCARAPLWLARASPPRPGARGRRGGCLLVLWPYLRDH
jgi:hypothetical protein